jgi:hypothetical protein
MHPAGSIVFNLHLLYVIIFEIYFNFFLGKFVKHLAESKCFIFGEKIKN